MSSKRETVPFRQRTTHWSIRIEKMPDGDQLGMTVLVEYLPVAKVMASALKREGYVVTLTRFRTWTSTQSSWKDELI
jgi:hypothetical protein